MKDVKKREQKKDKILLELDILLYLNNDILSINYKNTDLKTYKKIKQIYYEINILFHIIYKYYKKESLIILENWYKNKRVKDINIIYCINNFILKYITKKYIFKIIKKEKNINMFNKVYLN